MINDDDRILQPSYPQLVCLLHSSLGVDCGEIAWIEQCTDRMNASGVGAPQ